jgi:hypothetical protein
MNLWHTNDVTTVWKRIRVHHVIAAAGVALAVGVVVAMAAQDIQSPALRGPEAPITRPPSTAAADGAGQGVQLVYFVVATSAQALAIETAANEIQEDRQDWGTHYAVLSAGTPASRLAAEHLTSGRVQELGGPEAITVVDLR